jgi:hypothetical protein
MSHVWGYTIINDVTARERQRDHKQFYIGKSADTFCPMVSDILSILGALGSNLLYRVRSLSRHRSWEKCCGYKLL